MHLNFLILDVKFYGLDGLSNNLNKYIFIFDTNNLYKKIKIPE